MTERSKSFESLLETAFEWPKQGDRLFAESDRWWQNASVGGEACGKGAVIEHGYKRAGDILVEHALAQSSDMNFLIYPIVFCYRHYLELAMKWVLSIYGRHAGISGNTQSHKLEELWPKCRKVLEHFDPVDKDGALNAVEGCIAEFAKVDPGSYHFRYPTDRDGGEILLKVNAVDLANLRKTMDAIDNFFTGADGYMDACVNAVDYDHNGW